MPGSSSLGVFLSYRREDAGPYARSLQLQLSQRLPDARIFMDLDSIEPGLDFADVIEDAVNSCAVLVALIGRQWATLTDEDGGRRLDNPDDFVRFEVKTALDRGVRVIPVLIDGARPLRQQQLPADLHKLARLNAHKLSYDRYQDDADRLSDLIERVLAAVAEVAEADRKAQEEADRTIAITEPGEMSAYAPRIITIKVPVDKIGQIIGPKGKMINSIQDDTGAVITIEDDGTIYVRATDGPSAEAARAAINAIADPHIPEVGERYLGTVVKMTTFGAFVSLLPGIDGLLHITQIRKLHGGKRIENIDDVMHIGDKIQVEIRELDDRGKLLLVPVEVVEREAREAGV